MLLNRNAGQKGWFSQLKLVLQACQCEAALLQLLLKVLCHGRFFILGRRDVEGLNDDSGSTVWVKRLSQLLPELPPLFGG